MNILLVEDNSADACLLTELFAREGSEAAIHWVTNGYDALDYVFRRNQYSKAAPPDLILLDLNMPRINGYEVLRELKENPQAAAIPVIILTTSPDPLDYSQCKALGADTCLCKPHGLRDYEALVQQLIGFAQSHASLPTVKKSYN